MLSIIDPTKEVLNKGFSYPRGKVIGGNAMIYM
jgi:hypothetical protein